MEQTATHIPPVEDLMRPLGFSAADLQANHAGQIGAGQRERLQHLQRRVIFIGSGGFWGIAFLATMFIFFGQSNAVTILSFIGVMLTVINAIFVGMFARQWLRLSADLRDDHVEVVQGQLERVLRPAGRLNNYVLRVQDVDFAVQKDVFKLFRHETRYALYRAPHSRVLLAAEPLNLRGDD